MSINDGWHMAIYLFILCVTHVNSFD